MKIVRQPRKRNFTTVPNDVIENAALSFRARGLLIYMLSRPDGWTTSAERLVSAAVEGRDAIRTALTEIETAGYLHRIKSRDGGRFTSTWELSDTPSPQRETSDGDPQLPVLENRGGSTAADSQASLTKTESKSSLRSLERDEAEPQVPAAFEEFWLAYPRHVGKPKAQAAFVKAAKRADPGKIIAGAGRYRADPNRQDAFTAHPATWLNRDGWDDDPLPGREGSGRRLEVVPDW